MINNDLKNPNSQIIKHLEKLTEKLLIINPLNTLKRGYSVLYKNNNIINSVKNLKVNDNLIIKVVDGLVYVNINKLEEINEKENI